MQINRAPLLLLLSITLAGCPPRVPAPKIPTGGTHVVVFHVGQADAMLVVNDGRSMLVDAGATMSKTDRQNFRDIGRTLEQLTGARRLDYFVVSHYHQDHIGLHGTGARESLGDQGLWGLLAEEGVTVDTLVDRGFMIIGPKGNTQKHYERAIPGWIRKGKVRRRIRVKRNDLLQMGRGLRAEVIAADGNGHLMEVRRRYPGMFKRFPPSENDYSVVLKFTRGDFELITGGDLSGRDVTRAFGPIGTSYNDIESIIAEAIGDVEVYRVHHHGSKNSSNDCFMQVLHPEVSIFSSGKNSYHHPAERVYRALNKMGRVYIVSGADQHVYSEVKQDIVEGNVRIVVAEDGKSYTVNGTRFKSLTEAQERGRKGYRKTCTKVWRKRSADKAEEEGQISAD